MKRPKTRFARVPVAEVLQKLVPESEEAERSPESKIPVRDSGTGQPTRHEKQATDSSNQ